MKIVAIIQARMTSSRLPGKMMMEIAGQPVLQRIIERIQPSRLLSEYWLATTSNKEDDVLVKIAENNGIKYFRGSETDVLDRFYQTALAAKAGAIVRITGDCPLHDFQVVDRAIEEYLEDIEIDYVSNVHPPTFPDGLDVEVFSFKTLEKVWHEAVLPSEREHVTPYVWKHPEIFHIKNFSAERDFSAYRLTLDTKEDLDFLNLIYKQCQGGYYHFKEVIDIINEHGEWKKINKKNIRNEGYLKSINEENK